MASYLFLGGNLSDVNRYTTGGNPAPTLPGPLDTVTGAGGATASSGSLNVDLLSGFFVLAAGEIKANQTDDLFVGNINGAGGPATVVVTGTVNAVDVFKNGNLTVDTILGRIQVIQGGTINVKSDLSVEGAASVDLSMTSGSLTIAGALNTALSAGTQATIGIGTGATLNAQGGLNFGAGQTILSLSSNSVMTVGGAGTLNVSDDQIDVQGNATLNAGGLDVVVGGSEVGEILLDDGEAHFKSLNVKAGSDVRLRVPGGNLVVDDDVKNIGVIEVTGSTLKAKNLTIGDAVAAVDHCGDWTYTGPSGLFPINNAYVSVGKTFTINNATPLTLNILSGSSIEVGGDHGQVSDQLRVDSGGLLTGHGNIFTKTIITDGTIEAKYGTLGIDVLANNGSITGSGTLVVGDTATLEVRGNTNVTVDFAGRAGTSLRLESTFDLDTPNLFTGNITGLSLGSTIRVDNGAFPSWTGLAAPQLAHTELDAVNGKLKLVFTDFSNPNVNAVPPLSSVKTLDVAGDLAGKVFTFRPVTATETALSLGTASNQVIFNVDGKPTHGANPYIDSLIHGWAKWNTAAGPITYFFADGNDVESAIDVHGETRFITCENPQTVGWTDDVRALFVSALKLYSDATGLTFQKADDVKSANLVWWLAPDLAEVQHALSERLVEMPNGHLWQYFDVNDPFWQNRDFGGVGRTEVIHEVGHTLGLAHPSDGGREPDRTTFPGVPSGSALTGTNGQNQDIYTVMSPPSNRGWDGAVPYPPPLAYGGQGGLGAFDIAALQLLYGQNAATALGDTPYVLDDTNGIGTGWSSIWDAGGNDTISNAGSTLACVIDLRSAPLVGEKAGGYESYVLGVLGGFTIANGVVIENALGGAGNDTITGNSGDNVLNGGLGVDEMRGGFGNDVYFVDNAGDLVIENVSEGIDTANASINYVLTANVENLVMLGGADLQGYGNDLANILTGNAGNNLLNGFAGADIMIGGGGNDFYFVDNASDALIENPGTDNDTIFSTVHFTLSANVENLILQGDADLQGYGNNDANVIYGNIGNNLLNGGGGVDLLVGGAGNDTYFVDDPSDSCFEVANEGNDSVFAASNYGLAADVENLILQGNANLQAYGNNQANVIYGNAGNNLINAAGGIDLMVGRAGDDTYFVDDPSDSCFEVANEGSDAVFAFCNYGLAADVETLVMQGSGDFQGYGNNQANTLYGNAGNNLLNGAGGADVMLGGAGSDTYFVDNGGDVVFENANQGTDAVFASVNYTLTANVEALVLQAAGNLSGTGNGLGNAIFGNSGDNVLDGQGGADILTGNAGNDTFIFITGQSNGDTVVDFTGNGGAPGDSLQFVGYGPGASFTNIDATHWQVNFNGGSSHEIITFSNGASITASDVLFA